MGTEVIAVLVAFLVSAALTPIYIALSRRYQFGQQVRLDGPSQHLQKAGTPTMGGIVFLLSLITTAVVFAPKTPLFFLVLTVILVNALLGFIDDYQKVVRHHSLGLKARHKLFGQLIVSLGFYLVLMQLGHETFVSLPFTGLRLELGIFYPLLIFLMLIGTPNAVNLTDGIDGLAAGTVILALLSFLYIAIARGNQEMVYLCGILAGACLGFLLFNVNPAKVFMGDLGSLSLGAALAATAIALKAELILVIVGGVFVLETLSVIIQVISFRLTGKRVFLMSPLHHHFELKGWSEWQVVSGFWILGLCFALLGLLDYTLYS